MKCIVFSFILTTVEIYISTATEILYVLPDNSTDAISCPSQLCATLSQYLSENDTLPVLSDVEYRFLPGEHHVPANLILQDLYNFSIVGIVSKSSSPVVLVGYLQQYVIYIVNSYFVTIKNVKFKNCRINTKKLTTNLRLSCCFSCKIENVTFLHYGITGLNLIRESYLHNIKIETIKFSQLCCQAIYLKYSICQLWNNYIIHTHNITINQLSIHNSYIHEPHKKQLYSSDSKYTGLYISFDKSQYCANILINNSHFRAMDRAALQIKVRYIPTTVLILITNCTFESISVAYAIFILVSPYNRNVTFVNCKFLNNNIVYKQYLINVFVETRNNEVLNVNATDIRFLRCQFYNNKRGLLTIENNAVSKVNVLFESLNISHNTYKYVKEIGHTISIANVNLHIKGPINVIKNVVTLSIVRIHSCDILFSGEIKFDSNNCAQVISLDTYIKVMEYTNITFVSNGHLNNITTVENAQGYYQPYPFCLFQYVAMDSNITTKDLLTYYFITFARNYYITFNGSRILSENKNCVMSICYFLSHCKWSLSAVFYGYSPGIVNRQIISNDDQNCNYHRHICYCSQIKKSDCSIDILGPVHPGQKLQTNLCSMCGTSNNISTVLYAEVHNINLPSSCCKIVHQSQLI